MTSISSRHVLDVYATELRRNADDSKESAARAEIDGRAGDLEYWTGHRAGLMDAHAAITAVFTADQPTISPAVGHRSEGHRRPTTNPVFAAVEGVGAMTTYRVVDRITRQQNIEKTSSKAGAR